MKTLKKFTDGIAICLAVLALIFVLTNYLGFDFKAYDEKYSEDALLEKESFAGRAIVLAAQTTQDRLIFDEMRELLSQRFGSALTVLDTICDATRQRQEEAMELAGKVQAMVVAGGKTSGNTRRLAELARMRGVPTVLVETADELDKAFFEGIETVGLTAGASTPGYIIDEVEARLKSW